MRDPLIFADAFNQYLFQGRPVIKPETLEELDTTEIALPYGEGDAGVPEQKYRDVLKLVMTDGRVAYCILGIEGSSDIHYAIPVKNLLYDAIQLAHQVTKAAKSHKQERKETKTGYKPSQDEYLTGFYKNDKLLPVITLTIFWGAERWDGPLTLKEMYSLEDEAIMQYAADYKVNLIAPEQMSEEEIGRFHSSLKEVLLYIKYSKDKQELWRIMQKNPEFRNLDRQAAEVINITTNSRLQYPVGKERVDMCLAIEEMVADSEARGERNGEIRGVIKTCKKFNMPFQEVISHIEGTFGIPFQEAEELVRKYWE